MTTEKDERQRSKEKKEIDNKGLFGGQQLPAVVKEQVRAAMEKQQPYSVFQYYKDDADSVFPRIAKHPIFENLTLAVIATNAAYIAIDTDWNKEESLTPTNTYALKESGAFFQMMEHLFCIYFTFEWICRFCSFKDKKNCVRDGWFVFDSILVLLMVMETWIMLIVMAAVGGESPMGGTSILRLFRLLRLSRLMRMLRSLPELMILIKGMATAMKSVAYVMALLIILTYVFAIAFTQLAVGTPTIGDDYFANIAHSMYSLIIYATLLDDLVAFTDALRFESPMMLVLALIYIALAALTVMNMLIGVLCEVISAVADNERQSIMQEQLSEKMREVCGNMDKDKNRHISYKEFTEILDNPKALVALEDVGVDPIGLVDFAELFFFEDGEMIELTFEAFMEMVLDLRETNDATVKDILNVWMKIKGVTNKEAVKMKGSVESLSKSFEDKAARLGSQMDKVESMLSDGMTEVMKLSKLR